MRPSESTFAMPSMRLDGRVALVTGGGRGLGRGLALALAHAGADVAVVARHAEQVGAVCRQVEALGRRAFALPADLEPNDAAETVVEAVTTRLGALDIVVHAAGINVRQPVDAFTRDEYARVMRVNLESAYFLSQAAARVMRRQRRGRIICVSSVAAEVAIPRVSVYAMSKGGMKQMVKSLAIEWASDGITVNAIAPGRFWTSMTDAVFSDPELHAGAVRVIPLGRPGLPEDLAGAVVLLASDAGGYITGHTVVVDGGWTAGGGVSG